MRALAPNNTKNILEKLPLRKSTIAIGVMLVVHGTASAGPVIATWNGGTGQWVLANWTYVPPTGAPFPSNGSADQYHVEIDGGDTGTSSSVTLDRDVTIDSLKVDSGDTLTVEEPGHLTVVEDPARVSSGEVLNSGLIVLESVSLADAGGLDLFGAGLSVEGTVVLDGDGTGRLVLAGPASAPVFEPDQDPDTLRGRSFIIGPAGSTLINQNHTIEGTGQIGFFNLALNNLAGGVIDANVGDSVLVVAGRHPDGTSGMVNAGTLQASDGGILRLFQGVYDQTGGGVIQALDGSTVHIENSGVTIDGGALRTVDSGTLLLRNAAVTLDDVHFDNAGNTALTGAMLRINGSTVANAGLIVAETGSAVALNDTSIHGGVLAADATSQLVTTGQSSINDVAVSGDLINTGVLSIEGTGASVSGTYRQISGGTILHGNELSAGLLSIDGGVLSGNGTIVGEANIAGTASAGFDSIGVLNFLDDTLFSGFVFAQLGGTRVDGTYPLLEAVNLGTDPFGIGYDQYNVFSTATLGSGFTLGLSLIDGFDPLIGSFFDVLTADDLLGDLSTLSFAFPTLTYDRAFSASFVSFDGRDALRVSVVATEVPEPGTLPLAIVGVLPLLIPLRGRVLCFRRIAGPPEASG